MIRNWKAQLVALGAFAAAVAARSSALAQHAGFDGSWSVQIITEAGNCDRAYTYPTRIARGAISYDGEGPVALSGRVTPGGVVHVTVSRGDQRAEGTGRLSRDSGSGTWKGRSPDKQCSGVWRAERRG